ncbi:MAG TPA: preprotein translocase subunit SecG [Thermoanaerobaculia bacterium]|nr:preprotein translocase subunit SecG [Thermoanaerobaculia bacterium]
MIYLLYAIHVLVCIFLILVVLLQQGKGADLSVFGGGTTQTAFGARGATTLLHKLTVGSFIIFIITTLLIGLPQIHRGGATVMEGVEATTPAPAPAKPAGATPARPAPAPAQPQAPAERPPAEQ